MSLLAIYGSGIMTVSSGTIQVGGADASREGYPFSNAYTEWKKPWLEWQGAYSSSAAHSVALNFTGTSVGLIILGANFATINFNSGNHTLDKNRAVGDYRTCNLAITGTSSISLTIPAQATSEGYFKIGCIVPISAYYGIGDGIYPVSYSLKRPAKESATENGRFIKQADGRKHHILEYANKYRNYSYVSSVNGLKQSIGLYEPFFFWDYYRTSKIYLVRRLPDMTYIERGNHDFQYALRMEELA